ncbi:Purin 7 isoform 5 [Theobroma cacao]|uniref:phosphoribosylaminoimidazolesuccinocarboxamide synthase n=1 Tax=Theobroma cacao TaxID=3641 RepID=A0A061FF67_THECC|nr:Purin 7 isoform 5 [Theobroma cacao]
MAQCIRTTVNPPKTPLNSSQTHNPNRLFPSISSLEAKPKSIKYPKISLSVMSSQNQSQQLNPSLDALLNSGRKEEVFATIKGSVHNCLSETNLHLTVPGIESKTRGKVRDIYDSGDYLVLVTTDRQSAFDRILASIPFKGQVLNETSLWWFNRTQHITPNAVVSVPDKNVTIAKKCSVFPVEFVVRGFVTGSTDTSLWTVYKNGVRNYCGNVLPNGLVKNQKLTANILTPTTKAEDHDVPVTPDEIIGRGLMTQADFDEAREKALSLFEYGQCVALEHGLILVDTKYEFGKDSDGSILLIDEVGANT